MGVSSPCEHRARCETTIVAYAYGEVVHLACRQLMAPASEGLRVSTQSRRVLIQRI